VDRILKGEDPAAMAVGAAVPKTILLRADRIAQ
jgi:hypothetical protein